MNLIITIIEPPQMDEYTAILEKLDLKLSFELRGRGTASKRRLEALGLTENPKCAVFSTAGETSTQKLMRAVKRRMFIDAPGNGISVAVPIKSIGGAKTLEYMKGSDTNYKTPVGAEYKSELILVIANEGHSEQLMNAANGAGARGGTILHAKGTANVLKDKFFNLSLSDEKEILMIVASVKDKAAIMKAIINECGPSTEAGAITFSLPVSFAMGLNTGEEEEE
ncbi:MAG: hypothetical protein II920_07820 [Clostridia bacterium]|nr:hypothetical protein [Clostridia bacterium]